VCPDAQEISCRGEGDSAECGCTRNLASLVARASAMTATRSEQPARAAIRREASETHICGVYAGAANLCKVLMGLSLDCPPDLKPVSRDENTVLAHAVLRSPT